MAPLWHSHHTTTIATVFAALMAMHCVAFVGGREDAGAQTVRVGDSLLSPVQVDVMARISATAAQASARATPLVVAAFDDPELRAMLKAALPLGASTIDPSCPATELLARFRAEVSAAEGVHAFRTTPQQTQMSVGWGMNATVGWTLWQFNLAAIARGESAAAAVVADHEGFGAMNAAEEGLFGFPTFTGRRTGDPEWPAGVWPASMAEAADRPIYSTLNLRKVDGGNDIFGPVGLVWRQTTMIKRTILTPVDTGCFEYWCNTSWAKIGCHQLTPAVCNAQWSGRQCAWDNASSSCVSRNQIPAANCSQWPSPSTSFLPGFSGTLEHFDHLILPSARWWNGSVTTKWRENLVGQMTRMFSKWPHAPNASGPGWGGPDFTPATSIENFWEAEVLSPRLGPTRVESDVKMVLGLFDELFGTPDGNQLRQWCAMRGWALVWALGQADAGDAAGNGSTPVWTNGKAIYPSNQRLLDPFTTGGTGGNLSLPSGAAQAAMAAAWGVLSPGPGRYMQAVSREWRSLWSALPEYRIEPLYGMSCADLDCIGVLAVNGDCVCYT